MKPRTLHRVTLALSALAFFLWSQGATADLKQLSEIKVAGSTGPGPISASKGTVSLGDDSGKKSANGIVPPTYTVKKGDTLWDICDTYFANPWQWPRVWSYNPEILNPHWIYPGELVRLKKDANTGTITPAGGGPPRTPAAGGVAAGGGVMSISGAAGSGLPVRTARSRYQIPARNTGSIGTGPPGPA